jgi:ABC-type transport system involved in multi-copper enzyme maturation permease subunit
MLSETLLLAQNIKVTNWLTPVWIMSLGIGIGFLLVILTLFKFAVLQRIGGLNRIAENSTAKWLFGIVSTLVYLALFVGYIYWQNGKKLPPIEQLVLPLIFAVPICLFIGFGIWSLASRRMSGEISGLVFEGFLSWLNKVCVAMLLFAGIGFLLAPNNGFGIIKFVDDPMGMMNSLGRLPFTGKFEEEFTIEPSADGSVGEPVPMVFDGAELVWVRFDTDRRLAISTQEITPETPTGLIMEVQNVDENATLYLQRTDGRGPIPHAQIEQLYINNLDNSPATLKINWELAPVYREMAVVPFIALTVLALYLFYLIFAAVSPKVSAIAFSTFKTEVSQPLYTIVMVLGILFILGTIYVPYNTFGEDIKMYKDSGLTLIRVLAIFLAIWAASKSVAEEIEGRTALTVLSKPVGRRQFVLGKFTGISLAIGIMFIVLGLWFYIWVAYKPVYDFQENSKGVAEWSECYIEAIHVLPGLFLCFLEVVIFVAISVAISTRFGILANFLICFSIYVLGHLTPLLIQSSLGAFEPVVVFGQLVAIVFPVLNHFDVQAAINTNTPVPASYMAWSVIYTTLYGAMAMLLALVLFEDRDLA